MLQCWYQYCQSIGLLCGVTRTSTAACHTPISRGGFLCPNRLAAAGKLYADQTVLVDHLLSFLSAGHRRGFREGRRPVTTVSDGVEVPRDGGGERSHGEIMGRGPRWTSDHSLIPWAPTAVRQTKPRIRSTQLGHLANPAACELGSLLHKSSTGPEYS
jgi:hypothetical protein